MSDDLYKMKIESHESEPQTYGDRIRRMTDEELAEWLSDMHDTVTCPNGGAIDCNPSCKRCWLDWLKKNDTISRAKAIDAIFSEALYEPGMKKRDADAVVLAIFEKIKTLPSAQPEIIRCKDCKHFEYNHPYIIQGIPVLGHEVCNAWGDGCKTDENGYCFMAERRTDE